MKVSPKRRLQGRPFKTFSFIWKTLYRVISLFHFQHNNDVIMSTMASQITSLTIVYSTVYSGADQRKHQNSASLAFVRGIHRWPVNSPHKGPVTRKMFPFDDVIMKVLQRKYGKGIKGLIRTERTCQQKSRRHGLFNNKQYYESSHTYCQGAYLLNCKTFARKCFHLHLYKQDIAIDDAGADGHITVYKSTQAKRRY